MLYSKNLQLEELQKIISFGEEIKDDTEDFKLLNEVFKNKRREIISSFRFGYTIQERIMSTLFSNSDKKIKELPNVIFYKKKDSVYSKNFKKPNNRSKSFDEVDRIIFVDEDTRISNFLVYLKTKFQQGKESITKTFVDGETLVLPSHSINFIEVKTSANYFKEKNQNQEIGDYLKSKTPSETSSISNKNSKDSQKMEQDNSKKIAKDMIDKINVFSSLFDQINVKYSKINLIIIIDSFFQKELIDLAKIFSNNLASSTPPDLDLFFVHVDTDISYICEVNRYNTLNDNFKELKNNFEVKEKEAEKFKKRIEESEKEFKKTEKELKKTIEKNEKEFSDKISILTNELNTFKNKDKLRKNKKKLRNSICDECLKEVIKSNKDLIEKCTNKNYIIGNCQNNLFQNIKKLVHAQKECCGRFPNFYEVKL